MKEYFEVEIIEGTRAGKIFVVFHDPKYLLGAFLKTRRYEQGEIMPSFEKLDQILKAMTPDYETVLKIG